MNDPLLVLDVHYLAHRAFHSTPELSYKEKPTGVIFGFLKSISFLKDEFQTDRIAFCFEHKQLFRRDVYPPYKRKRHTQERTPQEEEVYSQFKIQISELRQRYLPTIGFKNIFSFAGMESDDIMAAIAKATPEGDETILVTADSDLYQCLSPEVSIYQPATRKFIGDRWFKLAYGIPPKHWALVKAIAGCSSDEVEGVKGVGEKTAIKYLLGTLKETSAAYKAIRSAESLAIVRRNRDLVELPYKGCPTPQIQEDKVSKKGWLEVTSALGFKSMAPYLPISTRKLIRYDKSQNTKD